MNRIATSLLVIRFWSSVDTALLSLYLLDYYPQSRVKPGLPYDADADVDTDADAEIEMNRITASASTLKDATSDDDVVSLKFDAQLSISSIL